MANADVQQSRLKILVAKLVAKNTLYSTILAGNILFSPREYKLQKFSVLYQSNCALKYCFYH